MKYKFINYGIAAVMAGFLMVPSPASAQHSRGGGQATGTAVGRPAPSAPAPAPAAPAPAPASAPASGKSGSEGSSGSGGGSGQPRQRSGGESSGGARAGNGSGLERRGGGQAGGGQSGGSTASTSRSRGDRDAIGHGVPRRPGSGGTTVVVPGGYYPWAWGGLGFGGFYGAYYDPWGYGGYDDGYGGGYGGGYQGGGYSSGYGDEGKLRLKVKPRDATVSIDGYYAGIVDEFDGVFQRLSLDSGPHRVEIRADGYETLTFEVRIEPGRTVTYTQELKKLP